MKISLSWIKEYLDFDLPPVNELVERIGAQLGAVEEVIDLGARYKGLPIIKVVACEPLENSDHLHRCLIDDAGYIKDVERNENGLVQVLTGAPNAHQDMLAVWLAPGVMVPATFDKDPFVLESRSMRGAVSHGMLASAKELAIGDSHEGLLDLSGEDVCPGDDFAEKYGLNDYIVDIENKMFTHRPDCFGQLGVAREIAGILGKPFKSPSRYLAADSLAVGSDLTLEVTNDIPDRVPRLMAVALKNVEVAPSPLWLQIALSHVGAKPINNVVDVTNYIMLLTGQPMHAYDYDKVATGKLGVRVARDGEKLALLNGKTIELHEADMVITDGEKPIGLGGVMGGAETEVGPATKNIILECATFDMYTIRRTSMRHGLFTDAVTRFNKGQSPLQNLTVLQLAAGHVQTLTGGEMASGVIDNNHTDGRTSVHEPVRVTPEFINTRLGLQLSADEIKQLLENVEFKVESRVTSHESRNGEADYRLLITAPFWRTDIEIPEDVVEEVGRLYGYDKLPLDLPKRDLTPAPKDQLFELKEQIRETLQKAGANEVLTYSFVHGNLLDKVGQDKTQAFQIANALSPDLQYYRLSLTPSLLEKVHPNIKAGHSEFALFEIGKAHVRHEPDPFESDVPKEVNALSFVFAAEGKTAKQQYTGAAYYQARKYFSEILTKFHVHDLVKLEPLAAADLYGNPWIEQMAAPFAPNRSAVLRNKEGLIWGVVGEFAVSVRAGLKLPDFCAGFEIDPLLFARGQTTGNYTPLPRFPKVEQDICLKVAASMPYQQLFDFVSEKLGEAKPGNSLLNLGPIDIFQREDDRDHKQITLRLSIASYDRTLTDAEVAKVLDGITGAAKEQLDAERV